MIAADADAAAAEEEARSRQHQLNNEYLAAALQWLRLRLAHFAASSASNLRSEQALAATALVVPHSPTVAPPVASAPAAVPKPKRRSFGQWLTGKHPPSPPQPGPRSPAIGRSPASDVTRAPSAKGASSTLEHDLAAAAARMAQLQAEGPAFSNLATLFALSTFEREVLLLCLAMHLDTGVPSLCAYAQNDQAARYPTFALALALFEDPVWEALAPSRPLRFWHLIDVQENAAQPLIASPLLADERIVNYCKGLNTLDGRLSALFVPFQYSINEQTDLAPSHRLLLESIQRRLEATPSGQHPVVHLVGTDRASKQVLAGCLAARLGLSLGRLPIDSLPTTRSEMEELGRLLRRESRLAPSVLYLDAYETASSAVDAAPSPVNLNLVLGDRYGLTLLDTRDVVPGLEVNSFMVDVQSPTPLEQRDAWAAALRVPPEGLATRLAGQFALSAPVISRLGAVVRATNDGTDEHTAARAWAECLGYVRPQLDTLAQRIEPKAAWDDLVLAVEEKDLLRRMIEQVRQRATVYHEWGVADDNQRGLGITALFAGESGTGKTMAAEVIANELQINLYRIDLSSVVSKYIGETEKNLRRLFDAADCGGTALFFDEADALFGKRSEVKDSHDRYANIEINYLLQRMESYRGVAILATNMKGALDQAFTRRLRFIVTFTFPGPAERAQIWQHAFSKNVPTADLDFARLAAMNLSGGSIRNVAMNATFLAAAGQDKRVSMDMISTAARMELRKMNRPINEGDFGLAAKRTAS